MKKEVTLQESLITDLRTLINEARNKVALMVNKLSHHWRDNWVNPKLLSRALLHQQLQKIIAERNQL